MSDKLPSQRIQEIREELQIRFPGSASNLWETEAVIMYLDEEFEKKQPEIPRPQPQYKSVTEEMDSIDSARAEFYQKPMSDKERSAYLRNSM